MFVFLSRQQREEDLLKNLEKERCLPGIFRPLVLEEVWLSLLLWKNWLYSFLLFLFFLPFFGNFNIHTYEEFSKAFSVVSHVRQESDIVVAAIYVMSEVYHYSLKTLLDFGFLDCVYSEFFVVFFYFLIFFSRLWIISSTCWWWNLWNAYIPPHITLGSPGLSSSSFDQIQFQASSKVFWVLQWMLFFVIDFQFRATSFTKQDNIGMQGIFIPFFPQNP